MTIFRALTGFFVVIAMFGSTAWAQPDLPGADADTQGWHEIANNLFQLSPDARFLAMCQTILKVKAGKVVYDPNGAQVRVWEIGSGRQVWTRRIRANVLAPLLFSPDGGLLISRGSHLAEREDGTQEFTTQVVVVDAATGQDAYELELAPGQQPAGLVFSTDGKQLIGGVAQVENGPQGTAVTSSLVNTWDAHNGKLLSSRNDLPELAASSHWQITDSQLVTNRLLHEAGKFSHNRLDVWSLPDFKLVRSLPLPEDFLVNVALAPDQSKIAWYAADLKNMEEGQVQVWSWNFQDEKPLQFQPPSAERSLLLALNFSPDGQFLVGSGVARNGDAHVEMECWFWNLQNGEIDRTDTLDNAPGVVPHVRLLPDGKSYLLLPNSESPQLRSLDGGALIRTFE